MSSGAMSTKDELLAAAEKLDARADDRHRAMLYSNKFADARALARDYDLATVLCQEAIDLLNESIELRDLAVSLRKLATHEQGK